MVRLDAALKVKDAADVDDQAAEEAADALEQAIEGLVRDVDRTRLESSISGLEKRTVIKELEDLVSQAEKLDPSLYTEPAAAPSPASWVPAFHSQPVASWQRRRTKKAARQPKARPTFLLFS